MTKNALMKRWQKNWAGPSPTPHPPSFGQNPKEEQLFFVKPFLKLYKQLSLLDWFRLHFTAAQCFRCLLTSVSGDNDNVKPVEASFALRAPRVELFCLTCVFVFMCLYLCICEFVYLCISVFVPRVLNSSVWPVIHNPSFTLSGMSCSRKLIICHRCTSWCLSTAKMLQLRFGKAYIKLQSLQRGGTHWSCYLGATEGRMD